MHVNGGKLTIIESQNLEMLSFITGLPIEEIERQLENALYLYGYKDSLSKLAREGTNNYRKMHGMRMRRRK